MINWAWKQNNCHILHKIFGIVFPTHRLYSFFQTVVIEKIPNRIFLYGGRLVTLQKNNISLYYAEKMNPSVEPLPEALVPYTETLTKTDNKINFDTDNLIASMIKNIIANDIHSALLRG